MTSLLGLLRLRSHLASWVSLVGGVLTDRVDLWAAALRLERFRLLQMVGLLVATLSLALLGLLCLSAAVVVALWPVSPVGVLVGIAGLYFLAALAGLLRLRNLSQQVPFLAATASLKRDCERLDRILRGGGTGSGGSSGPVSGGS
ncbi:MAG: phage holin family protein [Verrucomicrobiota bacterium]